MKLITSHLLFFFLELKAYMTINGELSAMTLVPLTPVKTMFCTLRMVRYIALNTAAGVL